MTTPYAGVNSYSATIPLPDDGEPAAAAILNPAWQRLADRTAYLYDQAVNVEPAARAAADAAEAGTRAANDATEAASRAAADTALAEHVDHFFQDLRAGTSTAGIAKAVWNSFYQRWYAVGGPSGGNDVIRHSPDGQNWFAETVTALGTSYVDIACNQANGDMLACNDGTTANLMAYTASTLTWAANTVIAMHSVIFNPVLNSWVVVGRGAALPGQVYCSLNSSPLAETAFAYGGNTNLPNTAGTGNPRIHVNPVSGRMIATQADGATGIAYSTSDDGVTWTYQGIIVPSFGGIPTSTAQSLAYSAAQGRWMLTIGETTTGSFDVWTSTDDGVTWTNVVTPALGAIRGGGLTAIDTPYHTYWIGYSFQTMTASRKPGLHVSIDNGATWKWYGYGFDGLSSTGRQTPFLTTSGKKLLVTMYENATFRSLVSRSFGDDGV